MKTFITKVVQWFLLLIIMAMVVIAVDISKGLAETFDITVPVAVEPQEDPCGYAVFNQTEKLTYSRKFRSYDLYATAHCTDGSKRSMIIEDYYAKKAQNPTN